MGTIDRLFFLEKIRSGGVAGWNRWFEENPGAWIENQSWEAGSDPLVEIISIDLSDSNFDGMNLDGVILDGATINETSFKRTSLRGARIRCADAVRASFEGADLYAADLLLSDLSGVSFKKANLEKASLKMVNRDVKTDFSGADLEGAIITALPQSLQDKAGVSLVPYDS